MWSKFGLAVLLLACGGYFVYAQNEGVHVIEKFYCRNFPYDDGFYYVYKLYDEDPSVALELGRGCFNSTSPLARQISLSDDQQVLTVHHRCGLEAHMDPGCFKTSHLPLAPIKNGKGKNLRRFKFDIHPLSGIERTSMVLELTDLEFQLVCNVYDIPKCSPYAASRDDWHPDA